MSVLSEARGRWDGAGAVFSSDNVRFIEGTRSELTFSKVKDVICK